MCVTVGCFNKQTNIFFSSPLPFLKNIVGKQFNKEKEEEEEVCVLTVTHTHTHAEVVEKQNFLFGGKLLFKKTDDSILGGGGRGG